MKRLLCIMTLPVLLSACSKHGEKEVQAWMDKTRQETMPSIPKLKEPKAFVPIGYDQKDRADPFNAMKLQSALAKMKPGNGHGVQPDLDRRKEALESIALDTLKMVGTMNKGKEHFALLEVDSKAVYPVKVGSYIGENFGRITKITDDRIEIKEIYLDSGGDWAERTQKLDLQEAKK